MDCDEIAYYYSLWFYSRPTDIGSATKNAFSILGEPGQPIHAFRAKISARQLNYTSTSNGSLMRTTPLAVWLSGSQLSPDQVYDAVKADAAFVHTNEIVSQAIWYYHLAIQYLLNNPTEPDRAKKAFDLVYEYSRVHIFRNIKPIKAIR